MANTFIKIATVTVSTSTAATIDFTSIPQTYTDLFLVASLRTNRAGATIDGVSIRFNNDTTAGNYVGKRLYSTGSSATTDTNNLGMLFATASNATASIFSNCQMHLPNYTSNYYKSIQTDNANEDNQVTNYISIETFNWNNTAAVNRLTLIPETSSFVQYSSATLYGIKSS